MKKEPVMWAFSPLYSFAWAQLDCGTIAPIESDGSGEAYDIISTERLMQTREAIDRFLANPITGKIKALNCQASIKNQRVRGEWFDLSESDIEQCKSILEGK